ncbi:MAG: hypothetical protein AVDCRST_MAG12-842 [uncultured Rubrobacteraceae bacterium]|uniref:Uncharacterized protein n=1 Tax=uncultured Rubrobacteraceae bacterium TaxID=349277 RepID=A0A6J4RPS8_9ACTN|nr:MAG: hypothetical protein AVDCRST_MAG12-842 [uncultured Rubrobacteraceae bacterium]
MPEISIGPATSRSTALFIAEVSGGALFSPAALMMSVNEARLSFSKSTQALSSSPGVRLAAHAVLALDHAGAVPTLQD